MTATNGSSYLLTVEGEEFPKLKENTSSIDLYDETSTNVNIYFTYFTLGVVLKQLNAPILLLLFLVYRFLNIIITIPVRVIYYSRNLI